MRSSPSGTIKTRSASPKSAKGLLLAALCIACACAASYVAGLHASRCKLTAVIHGAASPAHPQQQQPVRHIAPASPPAIAATHQPPSSSSSSSSSNSSSAAHTPMGRHTLLDFYNIPEHLFAPLTDIDTLQRSLTVLIQQSAMTYLGHSCHVFAGTQGVTCVFLLSESHLSLHTWPEHHYAALDIFTCGKAAHPEVMEQGLRELLQPGLVLRQQLARGGLELDKLSPEQRKAKVLHTFITNGQDGESLGQVLHQVPILHSSASRYQSITVIEVPGQLGRCLMLDNTIQFCSQDLDGYTDHMARHPLQLMQAVRGCGPAADRLTASTNLESRGNSPAAAAAAAAADADALPVSVTPVTSAPAASSPIEGHVTCRKSLLQPPDHIMQAAAAAGGAARTASTAGGMPSCLGASEKSKARVLLVGGGDGWIAGHLVSCYGDYVEHVTAVELDKAVSDVTQQHFRHIMHHGSPFRHPRITWEYQDAYAWALQKATQCSSDAGVRTEASNSSSAPHAPGPAATEYPAAAAEGRRLLVDTAGSPKIAAPSSHIKGDGSPHGSKSTTDCAGYDVVIIDSTDFTFAAASKLHSEAFYAALHALMRPQAALIQIVEIYMRVFEQDFAKMESALRSAGWQGVGRSSVFVPSYSGEALMLHAVKH